MDKSRAVVILGVSTLALLVSNIASCANIYGKDSLRKKEMLQRMDVEEKMSRAAFDNAASAEKIRALQKELDDETAAHQATKKALTQEQMIVKSLKEDLQKVTKTNDILEEELKKYSPLGLKVKK